MNVDGRSEQSIAPIPADLATEAALLASIFTRPAAILPEADGVIVPGVFHGEQYRRVFALMMKAHEEGEAKTGADLIRYVTRFGADVSGLDVVVWNITRTECDWNNWRTYHKVLKQLQVARRILDVASYSTDDVLRNLRNPEAVIDKLQQSVEDLRMIGSNESPYYTAGEMADWLPPDPSKFDCGLPTGLPTLDDALWGGLLPGTLTILQGRPKNGKTAFMLHIAREAAKLGKRISIESMEMSRGQLYDRVLSAYSGVEHEKISRGLLSPQEMRRVLEARDRVASEGMIDMHEGRGETRRSICNRMRNAQMRGYGYAGLVVDYAGLVDGEGPKGERISDLSSGLVGLAKECNIAVVLLSQLTDDPGDRSGTDSEGKRKAPPLPHPGQTRYTKDLEADNDRFITIHNPYVYTLDPKDSGRIYIALQLNRFGKTVMVETNFDGATMHFSERPWASKQDRAEEDF